MSRRTLLTFAGWLAAAVIATAIGIGAVQLIVSGFTAGGDDSLTPQEVAELLAATAPTPAPSASTAPPASPLPSSAPKPLSGPGGTVVAVCQNGLAYLVSWTPRQGYAAERVERGPYEHADVRFEGSAGRGRSEVRVRCASGEPTAQWTD